MPARPPRIALQLSRASLGADLLHSIFIEYGIRMSEATGASEDSRQLIVIVFWLLAMPAAWLVTHFFEKPIGDCVTRWLG